MHTLPAGAPQPYLVYVSHIVFCSLQPHQGGRGGRGGRDRAGNYRSGGGDFRGGGGRGAAYSAGRGGGFGRGQQNQNMATLGSINRPAFRDRSSRRPEM